MTIEEITTTIATLQTTLSRGERSVTFADRSVTYRTIEEILEALRYFEGLRAALTGRPRQWAAYASKGVDE